MFTLELCIHLCNFRCWEAGLKWVVWSKTTDVQDAFLSTFCSCCMKSYWGAITFAAIEHVLLCDPACMICMLPQTFRLSLCRFVCEWASMAPGDTVTENGKRRDLRTKCASRSPEADCAADGSFIFEAHEAWKDFHNSLRQFYENGELCDITLKVPPSSHCAVTDYFSITPQTKQFVPWLQAKERNFIKCLQKQTKLKFTNVSERLIFLTLPAKCKNMFPEQRICILWCPQNSIKGHVNRQLWAQNGWSG